MENYPIGLSLEEALDCVLRHCVPLDCESVSLEAADGRVLAEDIAAQESIPPFPRSPYDGYALRAADTLGSSREHGVVLRIVEEIPAGHAPRKRLAQGQAAKILTGAPIPEGADAVVKFEDTDFTEETVTVFAPCRSGENIVPAGEDIRAGEVVMKKGTVLDAALLGLLAGLGRTAVSVTKEPRVALFSTGDELVAADAPLTPGKIRNSSIYTLSSLVHRCGGRPERGGIVPDQAQAVAQALACAAASADLVLTTGGVSVGDYDMLRRGLEEMGAEILFWKMRIKPGAAFVAAVCHGTLVLSLSGNPSAAAVAFMLLGIPVLRRMEGRSDVMLKRISVRLGRDFPKKSPSRRFLPGGLDILEDGSACLLQAERQGNGMLHPLQGCTLLGELSAGSPPVKAGSVITAYQLFT